MDGNQVLLYSSRQFSAHTKSSLACIDKRTAQVTRNTHCCHNQISPLDHKMADNCVSLAHTNTVSSTITKLIKPRKTSNKSYSYNLLNCINKTYRHDLFYLQQEWEAWLAPVYKHNCVSLAHTNTVSSTITKLIKPQKTSNKSYSYNLLNCINKTYTHD